MELNGKYNTVKVFTDDVDKETISQIILLLNQEFVSGEKIRIMPDCHAGTGCVIGTTMTIADKIVPNLVGVDIGCGMLAVKLPKSWGGINLERLDDMINTYIPAGNSIHPEPVVPKEHKRDLLSHIFAPFDKDYALRSLGTLGGGNHFIELDVDSMGDCWLVIHSGSRKLGVDICKYYQEAGYNAIKNTYQQDKIKSTIDKLKSEGKQRDIENTIKILKMQAPNIPKDLAYVEGELLSSYINDMQFAQLYAYYNRMTIFNIISRHMNFDHHLDLIDTPHNYIDIGEGHKILRKGATAAYKNERLIIPMNMRDGILLCVGKGNPDWNYSAPHGAGRLMSRSEAMKKISMDEFENSMQDIYSTSVTESTIDEAPMVYKPIDEIMNNIQDTVEVIDVWKPVYNFKAH